MKIGDVVKAKDMKSTGVIVAVKKKEVLLDCDDTKDGKFYMSPFAQYVSKRKGCRLRWVKKKDLT